MQMPPCYPIGVHLEQYISRPQVQPISELGGMLNEHHEKIESYAQHCITATSVQSWCSGPAGGNVALETARTLRSADSALEYPSLYKAESCSYRQPQGMAVEVGVGGTEGFRVQSDDSQGFNANSVELRTQSQVLVAETPIGLNESQAPLAQGLEFLTDISGAYYGY